MRSTDAVKRALAPREATIVTGKQVTRYDLALMGYGQGYAGQMTPLQMALAAATIANMEGKLMKPRIEMNVAPQPFNQVLTPPQAARLRSIMGLVTGGPSGTARGVFGPVKAAGITYRWQNRNGAESCSRLRSEDGRAEDATQDRARQSRQHHSRV